MAHTTVMQSESLLALMGDYGNNVCVYDTESVILRNKIQVGYIVKSFQFASNTSEMIIVTKDCRIRFYNLAKFEGEFLRDLLTVHRGSVITTDVSLNSGYLLTGGEDCLIKCWDY
jgi:WD40 repeat protein